MTSPFYFSKAKPRYAPGACQSVKIGRVDDECAPSDVAACAEINVEQVIIPINFFLLLGRQLLARAGRLDFPADALGIEPVQLCTNGLTAVSRRQWTGPGITIRPGIAAGASGQCRRAHQQSHTSEHVCCSPSQSRLPPSPKPLVFITNESVAQELAYTLEKTIN